MNNNKIATLLPKLAKKLGEKSVTAACSIWIYQPKVPAEMKVEKKK